MDTNTLEQTANEALKKLIQASTDAVHWTAEQLPEVIEQLLMWKLAESIATNLVSLLTVVVGSLFIGWCGKKIKQTPEGGEWGGYIFPIAFALIAMGILVHIFTDIVWLQIWIAPKVYLIEYAAKIL